MSLNHIVMIQLKSYLLYKSNIMAAEDLVTQWAGASETMILAKVNRAKLG